MGNPKAKENVDRLEANFQNVAPQNTPHRRKTTEHCSAGLLVDRGLPPIDEPEDAAQMRSTLIVRLE